MKIKTTAIKYFFLYITLVCVTGSVFSQTTPDPARRSSSKDTSVLRTVIVSGRKNPIKPTLDGFIYHAGNDVAIAAGTAVDLLRRIPLVIVGQDGSPRVRGSSNVRVFIDNKPSEIYASSLADALQQIPAEDIATIEVITQPSARYDAEGTDAVINIVTKKNKYDGVTGRLRGVAGNRNQQTGLSLKGRKGGLILSLDGNWYRYNNTIRNTTERSSWEGGKTFRLLQQRDASNVMNTYLANVMATWLIDSLHSVNAGYRFRDMNDKANSLLNTRYTVQDSVLDYARYADNRLRVMGNSYNAGYTGFSRNKKRELNLLGTYFLYRETNGYALWQVDDGMVNHRERNDADIFNGALIVQADLVQSFGDAGKMEAGVKGIWREGGSTNNMSVFDLVRGYYKPDVFRSNEFEYDRSIYAGYLNYQYNGKSWSFRVGGRYEQSVLDVRVKDTAVQTPGDVNWLPNVLISKTISGKHSVKLSYAKKIERPYFFYMNPTVNYIDSLNIEYGNPSLLPELIHNGQLVYNYTRNGMVATISVFVDDRRRTIGQVRLVSDGKSVTTYRNMSGNLVYGASAGVTYNSGNKLTAGGAVTVRHVDVSNDALGLGNSGYVWSGNSRASYAFAKDFEVETSVQMEPRSIRLQGTFDGWFFYSLAVHKKWWKDRLLTSFTAENFFTRWQYRREVLKGEAFVQTVDNRYPVGFFKLGVSWRFGKKEIREPVRREVGE